jgi:hypothetical protein
MEKVYIGTFRQANKLNQRMPVFKFGDKYFTMTGMEIPAKVFVKMIPVQED